MWLGACIEAEEVRTSKDLATVKPTKPGFLKHLQNALRWPELSLAAFAFLLNFPWETIQAPLFEGMASMPHRDAVQYCTRAAFGDVAITLIAYWIVAATSGRGWLLQSRSMPIAFFVIIGVLISSAIEVLATSGRWLEGWTYSADMPILWGINFGLVPVLQWIVLPPAALLLTRRQLRSPPSTRARSSGSG